MSLSKLAAFGVAAFLAFGSVPSARADTPPTATPAAPVAPNAALPPSPPWSVLSAAYADTEAQPPTVTIDVKPDPNAVSEHWTFTNRSGQTVTGVFLAPKDKNPHPVILLLHGLGSNKDQMIAQVGPQLIAAGVAVVALDAPLHGERTNGHAADRTTPLGFASIIRSGVVEWRQTLDYLATRPEVDMKHVGLFGYSMGSMEGAILAGVDDRVAAVLLCVGGDPIRPNIALIPADLQPEAETLCPSNYIGHISPRPVYMINGRQDTTISPPAARLMQDSAGEPKTVVWVDSGHILPQAPIITGGLWLLTQLGVTAPGQN